MTTACSRKLRILTWHVHGNYLWYLTQVPHQFFLVTDAARSAHHTGRSGTLPWGDNVHEAPVERIRQMDFDVVLYQSRAEFEHARELLSAAQRRLPAIYLEHDPPLNAPTDERHWADDGRIHVVHVTGFNALMWEHRESPVSVIEHGVRLLAPARYQGSREQGVAVVNNLGSRGRRLGPDVFLAMREQIPLVLVGMGADRLGGQGEVANRDLPGFIAQFRFFFNPIRYTSLGLAVVEAMMVGLPIVGLATTEMPTVITNGVNGWLDTRPQRLADVMRELLHDPALARRWGEAARRTAEQRFGIGRFVADWDALLTRVAGSLPDSSSDSSADSSPDRCLEPR
ncbi:MAG TPA: glycosyltransferase family 4 protein [Burkholderiaceae bacterium]|nr:glycosyltransferase family 4 protein [Burkholderiaceae bacterium]